MRQALIPYRSKPVVFKRSVGRGRCGDLFNLQDVVEQRVKLHYMQQPQGRVPPKFRIVICVDATPFSNASATRGDVYMDLADSTRSAERPSLWSTWCTLDGSHDADPFRLANKLGQLDAQVVELQRDGIGTPTVTVEVECFVTGDGKGICAGHTKLKCRCWHCDLAFDDFGGDNLRPSDIMISTRRGAFLRSIPLLLYNSKCGFQKIILTWPDFTSPCRRPFAPECTAIRDASSCPRPVPNQGRTTTH